MTRHPSAEIYILLFQICSADDILSALEILHQGYELTTAEELTELWAEEMAKITIEIENASPALGETVRLRLLYGHIPPPAHWEVEYPGQMVPREHGHTAVGGGTRPGHRHRFHWHFRPGSPGPVY